MTRFNATRDPRQAPFAVGTRVRYTGTRQIGIRDNETSQTIWTLFPGANGTIVRVKDGRRGTGRQIYDHDGPMVYEDTGDPILDETRDGYSVWVSDFDPKGREGFGRCIDPDDVDEWEAVQS